MKRLALFLLFASSLLATTPGTPVELRMPSGTGELSSSVQTVAMNDLFIVVGVASASFSLKAGSPVLMNAGEVLVFNATTGSFVRRLRNPKAVQGGLFGRYVALQGPRAYIVDLNSRVCCFDLNTGRQLWTSTPAEGATVGGLALHSGVIEHLALGGDYVLAGMPAAWTLDQPLQGFEKNQGMVARINAASGAHNSGLFSSFAEAQASFGSSAARAGGMTVIGESLRDYQNLSNSGLVNIYLDTGERYALALPDAAAEDRFGSAVAMLRDHILVSAPGREIGGRNDAGTVLVINRNNNAVVKHLDAPSSLPSGASFGGTIAAHGSLAVIGASGSAWLYDSVADKVVQLTTAVSPTAQYGRSVAINSNSILIADTAATGGTASKGRVFLFQNYSRALPAGSVIATTKTAAPGTPEGTNFSAFRDTALSTAGKVMFSATLTGGGTTTSTNSGLWSTLGGSLDLVMRRNDLIQERRMLTPTKAHFAPDGKGRFLVRQTGSLRQNFFIDHGNSAAHFMAESDPLVVNGSTLTIAKIHDLVGSSQASSVAMVACSAKVGTGGITAQNDSRIGRKTMTYMLDEAREGVKAASLDFSYGQIAPRVATNGGRIAFVTAVAGAPAASNTALITKSIGIDNEKVVARKGDVAPGAGSAKFSAFVSESLNATDVVFRATLTGGAPGVTSGVWQSTIGGMVIHHPIALRGQQAAGLTTGIKFTRFMETFIADGGVILIRAQVAGPGVSTANDVGIWVWSQKKLHLLLREGDLVPGGSGARIGTIQRVDLSGSSHYVVLASLKGVPVGRNQALLTGGFFHTLPAYWTPALVLQKGSLINRPSPTLLKGIGIARNHIDPSGAGTKGQAKQVGSAGILFTATYSAGTDLILTHP